MVFGEKERPSTSTLVYSDDFPFMWEYVEENCVLQKKMVSGNIITLRAILALEEALKERSDVEHISAQELQRVEQKVDLLLSLVAQVLARDTVLPREHSCKLSAHGIEWVDNNAPKVGSTLFVHVYLSNKFPCACILPVIVQEISLSNSDYIVKSQFLDLPETVRQLLERFIFQNHRRLIAQIQKA